MSTVLAILAGGAILLGAGIVAIAAVGLLRLPDPFTRMHAATKAGVLGSGLLMLGVGLSIGSVGAILTGLAGMAFLLATSPIASHALGRAAYISGGPIAPSTLTDALRGVLPRNVFDISPGRVVRPHRDPAPTLGNSTAQEGNIMSAAENRNYATAPLSPGRMQLRALTAWLVGGPSQSEASATALDIAEVAGARLTGLSALDADAADHPGPVPVGGMAWARWLGDQRRTRMRERASKSIAEFDELCFARHVKTQVRHEERNFPTLVLAAAGADILVVPAGVDRLGEPASPTEEIATELSVAGIAPVLRVRRRPHSVRRILLIVSLTPRAGRLAHALIRTGLWQSADVEVTTIGGMRDQLDFLAREQAALLEQHGYRVQVTAPIDFDADRAEMLARLSRADAVICPTLSHRRGWFGSIREDLHELAAERADLILLP